MQLKFEDVIGNENVKNYLRKSIENNNILHSYMFIGTEGIRQTENSKRICKIYSLSKSKWW